MSISIKANEIIYSEAKRVASAEFRTIPHQIEFWEQIDKCALWGHGVKS